MCVSPNKVPDIGFVACRKCWQCKLDRVDDWVGRCIAESKTAKAAHVVTLTYGEDKSTEGIDHIRAALLTYSDVQKFMKRLRYHKFPARYFVVGEYGSMKGRAHWHIMLYWQKRVPKVKLRENFIFEHWQDGEGNPLGFTYWDKLTPEAVRYACKYLVKDTEDEAAQGFGPMVSKVPPLGDAYFRQLAAKYAQAGLSPQDYYYSFPDVRRVPRGNTASSAKGFREAARPVQFQMQGKTRENFLRYYLAEWEKQHGGEPPKSLLLWDYWDKGLDVTREQREEWAKANPFSVDRYFSGKVPVPETKPKNWSDPVFDEKVNCFVSKCPTFGQRLLYGTTSEGLIGWHAKGALTGLPLERLKKPVPRLVNEYAEQSDPRF